MDQGLSIKETRISLKTLTGPDIIFHAGKKITICGPVESKCRAPPGNVVPLGLAQNLSGEFCQRNKTSGGDVKCHSCFSMLSRTGQHSILKRASCLFLRSSGLNSRPCISVVATHRLSAWCPTTRSLSFAQPLWTRCYSTNDISNSHLEDKTPIKSDNEESIFEAVRKLENDSFSNVPTYSTAELNALLETLAQKGEAARAQRLFKAFFQNDKYSPTLVTYTYLMLAYINDGNYQMAMDIYYELRDRHEPDESIATPKTVVLDSTLYLTLINALTHHSVSTSPRESDSSGNSYAYTVEDGPDELYNIDGTSQPLLLTALTLFNDMRQLSIKPNADTYIAMLQACGKYEDEYVLEQIHKLIRMDIYFDPTIAVYRALMNAYSQVDNCQQVLEIFDLLPVSSIGNDMVSVALKSCLKNGQAYKAPHVWHSLETIGFTPTSEHVRMYLEALCRSSQGLEIALDLMETIGSSLGDKKPHLEEATVDRLIQYAHTKGESEEKLADIAAWK